MPEVGKRGVNLCCYSFYLSRFSHAYLRQACQLVWFRLGDEWEDFLSQSFGRDFAVFFFQFDPDGFAS